MVIAFDAKRAFRNNTGLGNYSRMVIGCYAAANPDDTLLLFTPSTKGREGLFSEMKNVSVITPRGLWRLFPSVWRTLGVGIRRYHVDLYHGLSHELPLLIPKHTRSVVTMHDLIVWRFPSLFPFLDRLVYRIKQRSSCRRADAIVAVSQQTADDIVTFILSKAKGKARQSKIHLIGQSADRQFYQRRPLPEEIEEVRRLYGLPKRFALCVGTVEQRKNQASVVRAFVKIPADMHLVIVGRNTPYADEVKAVCSEFNLEQRVHFYNNIAFSHFPELYSAAEVSIYMSVFEGFGIPVLESLCCNTPVVASNRSSIPEVGGDAALYANPDSPDEIADCVKRLVDDQELRESLKKNAAKQVKTYSAANVVARLASLYSTILSRQ